MHTCRGRIAAALSALLWSTLLLPGADSAAAQNLAGRDIRIGAIVPSSGPFAEWGRTNTVTLTVSKVDVLSVLVATLQTTRPASALLLMLSVVLPIVLQLLPSADAAAVTVEPLRIRRTQAGGV